MSSDIIANFEKDNKPTELSTTLIVSAVDKEVHKEEIKEYVKI